LEPLLPRDGTDILHGLTHINRENQALFSATASTTTTGSNNSSSINQAVMSTTTSKKRERDEDGSDDHKLELATKKEKKS
jgi:hypothetical protein